MEGANIPYTQNTPYINTIPVDEEKKSNGDQNIERRIRSFIRWNAAAMVVRANKKFPELGGHIGTFASAAADAKVPICPPNSGNFLFALTTIAAAFHLINDLILLSMF